jgi:GntR family transcriptional regulator
MATADAKSVPELDLRRDGTPIYVQLAGLFRRRIENGEWPVDRQIPTLDELALEFGVARATVRQATGQLKQEGLLARWRGRGTFVIHRPQREFRFELGDDWESVIDAYRGEGFATEILDSRAADAPPAPAHDHGTLAPAYHYIRRLNRLAGEPVGIDVAWLDARLYRQLGARAIRSFPTLRLLHERPGIAIARAMQTLTVGAADVEIGALLGVPLNAPLAIVARTLYAPDDTIICLYQGFNRGDTFRLKMRLK